MPLRARNQFAGAITALHPVAVNATTKVDIGGGNVVKSSITNEAAKDSDLAEGNQVTVVAKASEVMIGK